MRFRSVAFCADGSGRSFEIINPLGNSSDPTNWRASLYHSGSPGRRGCPNRRATSTRTAPSPRPTLYLEASLRLRRRAARSAPTATAMARSMPSTTVSGGTTWPFDDSLWNPGMAASQDRMAVTADSTADGFDGSAAIAFAFVTDIASSATRTSTRQLIALRLRSSHLLRSERTIRCC